MTGRTPFDPEARTLRGDEQPEETIRGERVCRDVPPPALRSAITIATAAGAAAAPQAPAPAAAAPAAEGEADYRLLRQIGRGGMGIVFAAEQAALRREVALKMVAPEHAADAEVNALFVGEALISGGLQHPNIVPVHDLGRDRAGNLYMSMELVRGVAWDRLIRPAPDDAAAARAGSMGLREHLGILLRVCDAISLAHARSIVHRDLKPGNVMVGDFGEVFVMDWGLAIDVTAPEQKAAIRGPTGTPRYMPPELAKGEVDRIGPPTDVYLLGGVLYELLTGTPPHLGEGVWAVIRAAEKGEVDPPAKRAPEREVPEPLAEIAMRALAPEPAGRYPNAGAFAAAIREYLKNEGSLQLSSAAAKELARVTDAARAPGARAADVYAGLAACAAELRQALKLWPGNPAAADGLVRAHLAHAEFALERGDLALAEAQLGAMPPGDTRADELRRRAAEVHAERAAAERRRRRVLAGLGALVLAVAAFAVYEMRERWRRSAAVAVTDGVFWLPTDEKIDRFTRAIAIDPTWAGAYVDLARAYQERAFALYVTDPDGCAADLDRALSHLTRAIELEPENAITYWDRGDLQEMRGDSEAALADYRRAADLRREGNVGLHAAALLAFCERRFADTDEILTRALRQEEGPDKYLLRAMARFCLGRLEEAHEDDRRSEEISKFKEDDWWDALSAAILIGQGRPRDAAARLVRGLENAPRSPYVLALLAYLAAKHGDLERARALEERARESRRAYARACLAPSRWRPLAFAKPPLDEIGRALALELDLAKVVPPEAPRVLARRLRGEERLGRGENDLALADADRVLADDPADGSARLLRARCLVALGHPEEAKAALELVELLSPHRAAEARELFARLGGGAGK